VLAAIGVSARWRIRGPIPYVLLAASLLANYLVPPATLLIDPPVLRYVLAATLAFLPVFFANLVFTASFRDTRPADMAFASNVLARIGSTNAAQLLASQRRAIGNGDHPGMQRVADADSAPVMDRDPGRAGRCVHQGIEDRPVGDRVAAVAHAFRLAEGRRD